MRKYIKFVTACNLVCSHKLFNSPEEAIDAAYDEIVEKFHISDNVGFKIPVVIGIISKGFYPIIIVVL